MAGRLSTGNAPIPYMQLLNTDQAFNYASGDTSDNSHLDWTLIPLQPVFPEQDALTNVPTVWEYSPENQNNLSPTELEQSYFNDQHSPPLSGSAYSRYDTSLRSDLANMQQASRPSGAFNRSNGTQLSCDALLSIDVSETVADHL
jgi:hypothetical protein